VSKYQFELHSLIADGETKSTQLFCKPRSVTPPAGSQARWSRSRAVARALLVRGVVARPRWPTLAGLIAVLDSDDVMPLRLSIEAGKKSLLGLPLKSVQSCSR